MTENEFENSRKNRGVYKILLANGKIAEVIFSTLLSLIKRPTLLATTQDMWEKSCIFVMSGIGIPLGISNILFFLIIPNLLSNQLHLS